LYLLKYDTAVEQSEKSGRQNVGCEGGRTCTYREALEVYHRKEQPLMRGEKESKPIMGGVGLRLSGDRDRGQGGGQQVGLSITET